MEIVIKIDDEMVCNDIKNKALEPTSETDKVIINALYNGMVLPKGHGDLIDRNALITELETDYHDTLTESGAHLFVGITCYIDEAKTIIAADKETQDETNC